MAKRTLRYAQWIIAALFALNLLAIAQLDNILTSERPSKPTGEYVVEFPSHGTSTYITAADSRRHKLAWLIPFVLIGISGVLYLFERPIEEIEGEAPKPF